MHCATLYNQVMVLGQISGLQLMGLDGVFTIQHGRHKLFVIYTVPARYPTMAVKMNEYRQVSVP